MASQAEEAIYTTVSWDWQAQSTDTKNEALKRFLKMDPTDPLSVKFLFLYGKSSTGKLFLLTKIAKELYGSSWESKVYSRVDEGKKFPYKLHAHKVESSIKVVLITDNISYYQKWKELYPNTKAFEFIGEEYLSNEVGTLRIRKDQYEELRLERNTKIRTDLECLMEATMKKSLNDAGWRVVSDLGDVFRQIQNVVEHHLRVEQEDLNKCSLDHLD